MNYLSYFPPQCFLQDDIVVVSDKINDGRVKGRVGRVIGRVANGYIIDFYSAIGGGYTYTAGIIDTEYLTKVEVDFD